MKTISKNFRIVTYGNAFSELRTAGLRQALRGISVSRKWNPPSGQGRDRGEYLLVSSTELDDAFAEVFRQRSTQATRLLVFLNAPISPDRLLSRIVDLQIRTAQRLHVIDVSVGSGKTRSMLLVHSLLKRLKSALEADDRQERILNATIENGVLHVVSPDFTRLDVPIAEIPKLSTAAVSHIQNFEIDEDGSFIYWPDLDMHLGWSQLLQIIDPEAARKALQKSQQFNVRYGRAVQKVRERAGLKDADIEGLSDKQLGRIEKGECRLTSNAIEVLSRAHRLRISEYLQKLAEALST
ncbi:MAG: DUF2442 domain-containing protein [Limisphaerales bacterium]